CRTGTASPRGCRQGQKEVAARRAAWTDPPVGLAWSPTRRSMLKARRNQWFPREPPPRGLTQLRAAWLRWTSPPPPTSKLEPPEAGLTGSRAFHLDALENVRSG